MGRPGQILTRETFTVIEEAHGSPYTVKSNFARHYAGHIAVAASLGWITTILPDGTYSNRWLVTPEGLAALKNKRLFLHGG